MLLWGAGKNKRRKNSPGFVLMRILGVGNDLVSDQLCFMVGGG